MAHSRMLPDAVLTAIVGRPETTTAFDALKAGLAGMSPEDQAQLAEVIRRLQAPHLAAQAAVYRKGEKPFNAVRDATNQRYQHAPAIMAGKDYSNTSVSSTDSDTASPPAGSPRRAGKPPASTNRLAYTTIKEGQITAAHMAAVNAAVWEEVRALAPQHPDYAASGYSIAPLNLASRDRPSIATTGSGSSSAPTLPTPGQQHAQDIARHLWSEFKKQYEEDPQTTGQVVISVLGNNSPEGVALGSWVFKALIKMAVAEAPELVEPLLQHTMFLNTGAAGKGAELALVGGVAVQFKANPAQFAGSGSAVESLRTFGFTVNDDGSLPDQKLTFTSEQAITFQFQNADTVELVIADGLATAHKVDPSTSEKTELYSGLPIRASGDAAKPGLLLGRTEAETNEHLERGLIERWFASPDFARLKAEVTDRNLADLIRSNLRIANEVNSVNTSQNAELGAKKVYWACLAKALQQHKLKPSEAESILEGAHWDFTTLWHSVSGTRYADIFDTADILFANTMQVSMQKQQQSARTDTTIHTHHANPLDPSKPGFAVSVYASPVYAPEKIVQMPPDQLAIHVLSFLKEFWSVQSYVIQNKGYHAPSPFDPDIYQLYIDLSLEVYAAWTQLESIPSADRTTPVEMCHFFNKSVWPHCEGSFPVAGTLRAEGLTTERSLLFAMLPTLVRAWQTKQLGTDALHGLAHGTCLSFMETRTPPTGSTATPDSPPVVAV